MVRPRMPVDHRRWTAKCVAPASPEGHPLPRRRREEHARGIFCLRPSCMVHVGYWTHQGNSCDRPDRRIVVYLDHQTGSGRFSLAYAVRGGHAHQGERSIEEGASGNVTADPVPHSRLLFMRECSKQDVPGYHRRSPSTGLTDRIAALTDTRAKPQPAGEQRKQPAVEPNRQRVSGTLETDQLSRHSSRHFDVPL